MSFVSKRSCTGAANYASARELSFRPYISPLLTLLSYKARKLETIELPILNADTSEHVKDQLS